ncbi:MAG: hypothetical protein HKN36_11220 [Hellea sp.]|nr:hypothetical protein [Hellea sp.]
MAHQYPFDLAPAPDYSLASFQRGASNQDAFSAISAFPDWPSPVLLLLGPTGCGKTHLGSAWASDSGDQKFLDDADLLDEETLFIAINQALNGEVSGLLLAAARAPKLWNTDLPDLRSRLHNIPVIRLSEPEDDILEPIIRKLFEDLGRSVKADVVAYILKNYERSVPAVSNLVRDIDRAASAEKRDITKAYLAKYLKRAGGG